MDQMNDHDKRVTLETLDREIVDAEFLPFLDEINRLPFAVTKQCCVGHMEYKGEFTEPANSSGRWGYLQLLMAGDAAMWLADQCDRWDWLWIPCSQLWSDGANVPGMTDGGSVELTFAWDAGEWPRPAQDLVEALHEYRDGVSDLDLDDE